MLQLSPPMGTYRPDPRILELGPERVGAFIGAYWAGWLYDEVGNYAAVWLISIALGVFSAIVHLPIRERPMLAQVA